MSSKLKNIFIGCTLLLLAGCGQKYTDYANVVPNAPYNAVGQGKTVVVMPFVDYSDSAYDTAVRRNINVSEAVMDKLALNGFNFPVQEDVFHYLEEQGVLMGSEGNSLRNDMNSGEWSSEMQEYLDEKILNTSEQTETVGLSSEEIKKIGKKFHADYVLRGRILEFKERQDPSWVPYKRGILPTIIEGTSRILVGFADVDSYDGKSKFDIGDRAAAMIELRLWVQDANTGEVVWTNHTNVEAVRTSAYADPQHDVLFMASLKRNACLLIHDFATYGVQQQ